MILNTDIEKVKVLYRLRYVIPLLLNSIKLAITAITRNLETGCPLIVNLGILFFKDDHNIYT